MVRLNLLCKVANMHEFKIINARSDLPLMRCLRCGKQKPVDKSFTGDYLGPTGAGVTGLG